MYWTWGIRTNPAGNRTPNDRLLYTFGLKCSEKVPYVVRLVFTPRNDPESSHSAVEYLDPGKII